MAVRVTEDLHFDVFGPGNVLLQKHGRVAEGEFCLIAGLVK